MVRDRPLPLLERDESEYVTRFPLVAGGVTR
jgi:hypothetical protein